MAAPTSGNTYRFRSNTTAAIRGKHEVGYYLNCNSTSAGVNGYYRDGSQDQIWNFTGTRLTSEKLGVSYCLSRSSTTSSTVQAGSSTLATSLSQISFELISGNNYRIKIGGSTSPKYLTAKPTSNADNASISLSWANKLSSDPTKSQSWEVERLIKVTDMPAGLYSGNKEFFHPGAGWTQGTYAANKGSTKLANAKALYRKCYGLSTSASVTDVQVFKNIFGALTTTSGTWQDGSFHLGYDFNRGSGTKIYAPYSGTVKGTPSSTSYGEVNIYANSRYYTLMHMNVNTSTTGPKKDTYISSTPTPASVPTNYLGTESNKGVTQIHLHIEAGSAYSSTLRPPIASSNSSLTTLNLL